MTGLLRNMQGVMHKLCGSFVAWTSCYINVQHKQHPAQRSLIAMLAHCCKRTLRKKLCSSQPGVWKVFVTWTKTSPALGFTAQTTMPASFVVWSVKQVAPRPSQTRGRHRGL